MRSVARAIDRHAKSVTITRGTPGSYVNGVWQAGASSDIAIRAMIQPITGKERENLPEGLRESGQWRVWSRPELKVNDALTIQGTSCLILAVDDWQDHGGYFRAIAGDSDGGT